MNNIDIEGVIGWDVTAADVKRQLRNFGENEDVTARVNSPGGYIDDGFGIYTALKNRPGNVHMHITGLAASMASVIVMAGNYVSMEETGIAMIHPPSSIAWGTAVDMRKEAEVLDKYESRIVRAYERRTLNLTAEELSNAIAETSWYTAEEFLEAGFIDEVTDGQPDVGRAENRAAIEWLRVAQYKNIPKAAQRFFEESVPALKSHNAGASSMWHKQNHGGSANTKTDEVKNVSVELEKLNAELVKVTAERDAAVDTAEKATNRVEALQAMVSHKNASPENIKRCMAMNLDAEQVAVFMDGETKPSATKEVETPPATTESRLDKLLTRMEKSEVNEVKPGHEVEKPAATETDEERYARLRSA